MERLRKRGTEDEAAIQRRLKRAREETSAYPEYDYLIINADVAAIGGAASRDRHCRALPVARLREGFAAVEELVQASETQELDELARRIVAYNPEADVALIRRAYDYSARMHGEQKRKSGEPYVIHPLNVALISAQLKLDVPSIVTGAPSRRGRGHRRFASGSGSLFGAEVARLVDGVTKVSKITFSSREEKQAENFRKMIIAMAHDIRVVLIKLADRLHNMRTLDQLAPERAGGDLARDAGDLRPDRPSAGNLLAEVRTRGLRIPLSQSSARTATLKTSVASSRAEREDYIRAVIEILSRRLEESGVDAEVTGRPKHFYSIHTKMQQEELTFDEIYDLVAFRIIVGSVRECYEALGVVHANWKPMPGRFKDYIALPKANMYQSLHTTVIGPRGQRMEVQIRTREMHRGSRARNRCALELQGGRVARKSAIPSASPGYGGWSNGNRI